MTLESSIPADGGLHPLGSGPSHPDAPILGCLITPDTLAALQPMDVGMGTLGFNAWVVARLVARCSMPSCRRRMLEVVAAKWRVACERPDYWPGPDSLNAGRIEWIRRAIDEGWLSEELLDRRGAAPAPSATPAAPEASLELRLRAAQDRIRMLEQKVEARMVQNHFHGTVMQVVNHSDNISLGNI